MPLFDSPVLIVTLTVLLVPLPLVVAVRLVVSLVVIFPKVGEMAVLP